MKLLNEVSNLYSSRNWIGVLKEIGMIWVGYVGCMEEKTQHF
jgi:hypothetical protein